MADSKWWEKYPLVQERTSPSQLKNMQEGRIRAEMDRQAKQEQLAEQEKYRQEVEGSLIPGATAAKQATADTLATGSRLGAALMSVPGNIMADIQAGGIGQGVTQEQAKQLSPSNDVASMAGYAAHDLLKSQKADELNRRADLLEQAQQEEDKGGFVPDWAQKGSRGALRSLMGTIPAGVVGGPAGMIGMAAAGEANQAITTGDDAGLTPDQTIAFAAKKAVVEAVPAAIMQKIGLPGFEGAVQKALATVAGKGAKQGAKQALAGAAKSYAQELPEELITELGHAYVESTATDPNAMSWDELRKRGLDTAIQTAFATAFSNTPQVAAGVKDDLGRKRRLDDLRQVRSERDASLAGNVSTPEPQPSERPPQEISGEYTGNIPQPEDSSQVQPDAGVHIPTAPTSDTVSQEYVVPKPVKPNVVEPKQKPIPLPAPVQKPPLPVPTGNFSPPEPDQLRNSAVEPVVDEAQQPIPRQPSDTMTHAPVSQEAQQPANVQEPEVATKDKFGKPIKPATIEARKDFLRNAQPGATFTSSRYPGSEFQVSPDGTLLELNSRRVMSSAKEMANVIEPGQIKWTTQKPEQTVESDIMSPTPMSSETQQPESQPTQPEPAKKRLGKKPEQPAQQDVSVSQSVPEVEQQQEKGGDPDVVQREGQANAQAETSPQGQVVGPASQATAATPSFGNAAPSSDTVSHEQPARNYGTVEKPDRGELGKMFADEFANGRKYERIDDARNDAGKLLGETPKSGTPAAKAIDEAVEVGVVRAARKIVEEGAKPRETFDKLVDLYNRQPNLGVRTSTSMKEQAYSTPAPLAYLANNLAGVSPNERVYDSSAGNGMLLIGSKKPLANELNADRAEALRSQDIETTNNDAVVFRPENTPDKVIINPPFGKIQDDSGADKQFTVATPSGNVTTTEIDHAITLNTLNSLPENGKAVIIIGSKGFEQGKPKSDERRGMAYLAGKKFYDTLYQDYNVTDHFTVSGDLYRRQGAGFPVDVIVVNGKGASNRPKPYNIIGGGIPEVFNTWEQLADGKLNKQPAGRRLGQRTGTTVLGSERVPTSPDSEGAKGDNGVPVLPGTGGTSAASPGIERGPRRKGLGKSSDGSGDRRGSGEGVGEPTKDVPDAGASVAQGSQKQESDSKGEVRRLGRRSSVEQTGDTGRVDAGESSGPSGRNQPVLKKPSKQKPAESIDKPSSDTVSHKPSTRKPAKSRKPEPKEKVVGDEYQVHYTPQSSLASVESLLPRNHVAAVERGLEAIRDKYGDLDKFVGEELEFSPEQMKQAFSGEQVDALAMAIAAHKDGRAFITGDQTGLGKGRIAAGMMVYAKKQGLVPVFLTQKPTLYADMVRDLIDIGVSTNDKPFRPLPTNALSGDDIIPLPDGRELKQSNTDAERRISQAVGSFLDSGELTAERTVGRGKKATTEEESFDAIFTTYNQMTQQAGRSAVRQLELLRLAPEAFFILDESHEAGGSAEEGDRSKRDGAGEESGKAQFIRSLIKDARGLYFSSATYAKRPSLMDLYARTGMDAATEGDASKLQAAISSGGIPLQQVVSEQLVESGAYLRRERSFDGVEFAPKITEIDLKSVDNVASVFRIIDQFDRLKEIAVKELNKKITSSGGKRKDDSSTGQKGMKSTTFSSILWNLNDQMLLASKAGKVADEAIESIKKGESPVIYIDSTLEAALDRNIEKFPADAGDEIDFSFRDLLMRYLERSREILIQEDASDKDSTKRHMLSDDELGPEALEAYKAAEDLVNEFSSDLPASPIDLIRKKIEDAGYSVGEITGRSRVINYGDDGKLYLGNRPKEELGAAGKTRTVKRFNDGSLDVVILNQSGATGISMHASEKFENQKPRHMIIAQPARNIDTFMQSLGRVHRTGQVKLPRFTLLMSNAPSETRPAAILSKKLSSLNANVTADSEGSVSFDVPDVLNKIGDAVVADYLADNEELNLQLGELVETRADGSPRIVPGLAAKVTGRMALAPVKTQEEFWSDVVAAYNQTVEELDRLGKNPLKAGVAEMEAKTLESIKVFDGDAESQNTFAQPAFIEKVMAKRPGEPMKPEDIKKAVSDFYGTEDITYARNEWVGKVYREALDKARSELSKIKSDEIRSKAETREEGKLMGLRSLLRSFSPGESVSVWEKDNDGNLVDVVPGIILSLKRKDAKGRSTSLSKWVAEIALGSPDRVLRLTLSQMRSQEANEEIAVLPNNQMVDNEVLKSFKENESSGLEYRYVGTGNILAAASIFQEQHGRVTFFTDNDGSMRRGVLLPRKFSPEKWAKERPVVFESAPQVLDFMSQGGTAITADGVLSLQTIRGELVVRAPKSKQRSGKYTLNDSILKAAGHDFISIGSRMELVVSDPDNIADTVKAVLGLSGLVANDMKDDARGIVGDKALFEKSGKDRSDTVSPQPKRLDDKPIRQADIVETWSRIFDVPIRVGGYRSNMGQGRIKAGIYKHLTEIIRMAEGKSFDMIVASHEVGHHVDKMMDWNGHLQELKNTDRAKYQRLRTQFQAMDYAPAGRVFEGMAEAFRYILTGTMEKQNPQMEAINWLSDLVDQHPTFGPAMRKAITQAKAYQDQGAIQRARSSVGGAAPKDLDWKETVKQELMDAADRVYAKWVDDGHILKRFSEDVSKRRLGKTEATPYELLMAYRGTAGARAARMVEEGPMSLTHSGMVFGPSLEDALSGLQSEKDYQDAQTYAVAKHGLTLPSSYNFGMSRKDAQEFVDNVASDPAKLSRYEKFANGITDYNNALLEVGRDAGLFTTEEVEKMLDAYGDNYVPLWREHEDSGLFGFIGSAAKRFGNSLGLKEVGKGLRHRSQSGSGRPVKDLIESSIARTQIMVDRALRQQIHEAMVKQADPSFGGAEGLGGWFDRIQPKTQKHDAFLEDILNQLVNEEIVTKGKALALRSANALRQDNIVPKKSDIMSLREHYGIDPAATDTEAEIEIETLLLSEPELDTVISFYRSDYRRPDGKHVIRVSLGGKPYLYEVDGDLYDALSLTPGDALGPVLGIVAGINRTFKLGSTGLNTAFGLQNLVADAQTAAVNSKELAGHERYTKSAEWAGRYIGYLTNLKPSEFASIYRSEGGEMFSAIGSDKRDIQNLRRRMMQHGTVKRIQENPTDGARILLDGVKGLGDVIRTSIAFTDVGPRLAEFEATLKKYGYVEKDGKSYNTATKQFEHPSRDIIVKAMNAAADITYNYRRAGSATRRIELFLPFTNAAIQSLDKTMRVLKETGQGVTAGRTAFALAKRRAFALAVLTGIYMANKAMFDDEDELPWWLRGGYMTSGAKDGSIRLKMSREYSWLANMLLGGVDAISTGDTASLKGAAYYEAGSKLPGLSGALSTMANFYANYDPFFDRDIVPSWLQGKRKSEQFDDRTSEVSKAIAGALNLVAPRELEMSPMGLDYLLSGFTGGAYKRWTGSLERALGAKDGGMSWKDIPFLRGLYVETYNQSVSDFYRRIKEVSEDSSSGVDGADRESFRLGKYKEIMKMLRDAESDSYDPDGQITGLARDAIGKKPLAQYPNPLFTDVPPEVRTQIVDSLVNDIKVVSEAARMPEQQKDEADEKYQERVDKWESNRELMKQFIDENKESPIIKEALELARNSKTRKALLQSSAKTWDRHGKESWEEFSDKKRRLDTKKRIAGEFQVKE